MTNSAFFIVAREKDIKVAVARNPDSFIWSKIPNLNRDAVTYTDKVLYNGWEFVDRVEYDDYQEAKQMMTEYRETMPSHTVLIHCKYKG